MTLGRRDPDMNEPPDDQRLYEVRYQYATYSGTRRVWADDREQAVAIVKRELAPHMSLSMAYESYHAEELCPRT